LSRYRGAIAIVAIFVVLLVVVLLTQPSNTQAPAVTATPTVSAEEQKLEIIKLPDSNGPNRLVIKQTNPEKTVAFKLDGNWKLEGNESFALDSATVADAARSLSQLKGSQLVEENATNLSQAGLDKPSLEITLFTPTFTRTLQVGISNTITGVYYVKLSDGNKIWTVNPGLINQLKSWVNTPPPLPPTPTPLPTLPPTPTPSPTSTEGTPTASATPAPTPATSPSPPPPSPTT
jgi:hypothetical protein